MRKVYGSWEVGIHRVGDVLDNIWPNKKIDGEYVGWRHQINMEAFIKVAGPPCQIGQIVKANNDLQDETRDKWGGTPRGDG